MDSSDQDKRTTAILRSRRNVLSMASIFAGTTLAGSKTARAFEPNCGAPGFFEPCKCFLRGARIWTPIGERKVEDLGVNDLVITSSGEAKPIKFISARRHERQLGQKWEEEIAPVRVARSALGPNTPHRDLYLSRYHRLYLD
jgi:Hint domain